MRTPSESPLPHSQSDGTLRDNLQLMGDRSMKHYELRAVIVREGDWFVARCLNLPVTSQGRTREQAQANLREAATLYLEAFGDEDLSPPDDELTLTTLTVSL